ncbi:MAG: DEAD/DEAH box helicase [bacterium]|nr:DEAD/DEAH box helicase [bacterium]
MFLSDLIIPDDLVISESLYESFKKDEYYIFYHLNKDVEQIRFEALRKEFVENFIPGTGAFFVTCLPIYGLLSKEILQSLDIAQRTLLKYVRDYFVSLSKEQQDKILEPIADYFDKFENYDEKMLKNRLIARGLFAEMISNIEKATAISNNSYGSYSLRMILLKDYENDNYVFAKPGLYNKEKEKANFNLNVDDLINCYKESKMAQVGQFRFLMNDDSFDEVGQELLSTLLLKFHPETRAYNVKDFIDALICFGKNNIPLSYETPSKLLNIKYLEKPEINFDEKGEMSLSPELSYENALYFGVYGYIKLNEKNKEIFVIKFPDKSYYYLYDFLKNNNDNGFSEVSDLVPEKLLPLISNKSNINDKYQEKINKQSIKIRLFADLVNEKLHLKTKYFIGSNEISLGEASENAFYHNKILNYQIVLKDFNLPSDGVVEDENIILDFICKDLSPIKQYADILLSDAFESLTFKKVSGISISSSFDCGLLNLKITNTDFDEEDVRRILEYYKKKRKFIVLKNSIISLEGKEIEELNELNDDFNLIEEESEVPLYEIFKLSSYKDNFDVNFDEDITNILNEIKNFKKIKEKPLPIFKNVLRPYQIDAFKWLVTLNKYKLGGILADDMGLGKTLEMITFISSLNVEKPILIVCPKSLSFNWEHEFFMWNKDIKVVTIVGDKEDRKNKINNIKNDEKVVFITPYDSLRNDVDLYQNKEFSLVILDEAQYIKNSNALKTKAIKSLKADNRFVLTGTPIENSLTDLWSIFDFLMPGYLYSFEKFRSKFESTIIKGDEESARRLKAKITPFILRRVKGDVLKDLPPKTETLQICGMKHEQRQIYDAYLLSAKKDFAINPNNKLAALAALMRLRQICVDPSMFIENYEEVSEKMEFALQLVNDAIANGHKILVFSSFTKSLEHFREILTDNEIPTYYICGETSAKDRLMYCELFNKTDDVKVFLISLKAGGTGLNLTGADIIIHLDPWWNVAAENQASDRAHRIGQTRPVTVIKLVTKDSIEEKVIDLQDLKKDLMDNYIGNGDKGANFLSADDIKFLLD